MHGVGQRPMELSDVLDDGDSGPRSGKPCSSEGVRLTHDDGSVSCPRCGKAKSSYPCEEVNVGHLLPLAQKKATSPAWGCGLYLLLHLSTCIPRMPRGPCGTSGVGVSIPRSPRVPGLGGTLLAGWLGCHMEELASAIWLAGWECPVRVFGLACLFNCQASLVGCGISDIRISLRMYSALVIPAFFALADSWRLNRGESLNKNVSV